MESSFIDPVNSPEWDEAVRAHPESSFFHTSAWAKVLSKTYGHKPLYLRLSQRGGTVALIPLMEVRSLFTGRRGVCLPFTDLCGPLVFEADAAGATIDALSNLGRERNWRHFEVRGSLGPLRPSRPSLEFFGHSLALTGGLASLHGGFAASVRQAIRKAERSGVKSEVTRTREAMLQFYALHVRTRRRHGLPPQPLSFFLNIHEEIIKDGAGFIVMATHGSRPVAAAVYFNFGGKAIYKFGASAEDGQETRANNLVMWEGIKHLAGAGCESLHFGRTSAGNEGLRRFKLGWGTREESVTYQKFDFAGRQWVSGSDKTSGFHTAIFSRLPLVLNRIAGAMIYPHLD